MNKKIVYTRPENNRISIITPAPKENILNTLRGMDKHQISKWLISQIEKNEGGSFLYNWKSLADYVSVNFSGIWDVEFEDEFFSRLIWSNVPEDAINPREIDDLDIPQNREFRNAWCDVTTESRVDIDLSKAKDIQLERLRLERQQAFIDLGFPQKLNPELEEAILSPETREQLKALRDATEPLKALEVSGYNDEKILEQIRTLGKLNKNSFDKI